MPKEINRPTEPKTPVAGQQGGIPVAIKVGAGKINVKPLTKEENKILLGFIENSIVLNNKSTNATTNRKKIEEWKRIASEFNSVVTSCYRTPRQLRLKWENLKKSARKRSIRSYEDSDGPPKFIPPDEVLDKVSVLINASQTSLSDGYGGDAKKNELDEIEWVDAELTPEESQLSDNEMENVVNILSEMETVSPKEMNTGQRPLSPKPFDDCFNNKAKGIKRNPETTSDENRSTRNLAIANYYNAKTKLVEATLERVLLENKKIKFEIEKMQNVHNHRNAYRNGEKNQPG